MPCYDRNGKEISSLSEKWNVREKEMIQVAGSGGKTTLIAVLARENRDKKVCVTTTTKRHVPSDKTFVLREDDRISLNDFRGNYIEAGLFFSDSKVCFPGKENLEILKSWADLMLVEADGSRRLPLKAVYPHEPVFLPEAEKTLIVSGLSALGNKIEEVCYGYELVQDIFPKGEPVTGEIMMYLLKKYYLEPFCNLNPIVVLSQADTEEKIRVGLEMIKKLDTDGILMDIKERGLH